MTFPLIIFPMLGPSLGLGFTRSENTVLKSYLVATAGVQT